jgi:hypothetical protein
MKRQSLLIRHEAVYHAALWWQAASLPLPPQSLRGLKKACRLKGKKQAAVLPLMTGAMVLGEA